MTFIYYLAIFLFLTLSSILCLVILVQESKSMGLGASFGGDAGESLFGTSTAVVLKKFTAYLGVIFIIACVFLSIWSESMGKSKPIQLPSIEQQLP
jgi:preprotein translocase subunit SecG